MSDNVYETVFREAGTAAACVCGPALGEVEDHVLTASEARRYIFHLFSKLMQIL